MKFRAINRIYVFFPFLLSVSLFTLAISFAYSCRGGFSPFFLYKRRPAVPNQDKTDAFTPALYAHRR